MPSQNKKPKQSKKPKRKNKTTDTEKRSTVFISPFSSHQNIEIKEQKVDEKWEPVGYTIFNPLNFWRNDNDN